MQNLKNNLLFLQLVAGQQEKLHSFNLFEAENLNIWKLDSLSFEKDSQVMITYDITISN